MKRVLLISDLHANPWALRAIEQAVGRIDHVICAGDTVNYGPEPSASIAWLIGRDAAVVRGNHDHAVAFAVDPKASQAKLAVALTMRDWTRSRLGPGELGWLCSLPRRATYEVAGAKFMIVHGTPVDPLYDYRLTPQCSDELLGALTTLVRADVLVVGHTHLPFQRSQGSLRTVNPGSVGQPLDGDPRAAYALWEDGVIRLCRAEYDRRPLLDALARLPVNRRMIEDLQHIVQTGAMA